MNEILKVLYAPLWQQGVPPQPDQYPSVDNVGFTTAPKGNYVRFSACALLLYW